MVHLKRLRRPLPWRRFLGLAWPMALAGMVQPLTQLTDAALLGHLQSADYLAAVAIGGPLLTFMLWIFSFLRMGSCAEIGKQKGSLSPAKILAVFRRYQLIALTLSAVSVTLAALLAPTLTSLMSLSSTVGSLAQEYVFVRLVAAPATLLSYVLLGTLIGLQQTRKTLWLALVVNIANLLLDLLFILVLDMASLGAAIASVCAEYAGLVVGAWFLHRAYTELYPVNKLAQGKINRREGSQEFRYIQALLPSISYFRGALASASFQGFKQSSSYSLNIDLFIRTFFMLLMINTLIGFSGQLSVQALAAMGLVLQLSYFLACGVDGFANACETLCAESVGTKNTFALIRRVETWIVSGFVAGGLLALVLTGALLAAAPVWISLLSSQADTRQELTLIFHWFAWFPILSLPAFILDGAYIGLGYTRWMRLVAINTYLLVLLPLGMFAVYVLNSSLALMIVFLFYTAVRSLAMYWPILKDNRLERYCIRLNQSSPKDASGLAQTTR